MNKFMNDLDESVVADVIRQGSWGKCGVKVFLKEEAAAPVAKEEEIKVEETPAPIVEHKCPLCESTLKEALDDELITERVEMLSEVILEVMKEEDSEDQDSDDSTDK